MPTLQDFTDELDKIDADLKAEDADVTALEAKIADLKGQIGVGGLSPAEEQTLLDRLTATEAALAAANARLSGDAAP